MRLRFIVSGVHSGPNPSPGLGVARSLRIAYPSAEIVGVDYGLRNSGIHDTVLDDVILSRPWEELDLGHHALDVAAMTGNGEWWVPGLDLEVEWLASLPSLPPRCLVPRSAALTRKPATYLAAQLGCAVPPTLAPGFSWPEAQEFCGAAGWRVWAKGTRYEAVRVTGSSTLQAEITELEQRWGAGNILLEVDIDGQEVSIAFAAFEGRLLGAVQMDKRIVTTEGKTWAGAISKPEDTDTRSLESVVRAMNWTGGGEIELIRDFSGKRYLIDCNPRFPAWIFGATLAGENLPASLVHAAGASVPHCSPRLSGAFVRVVQEIPLRIGFPLPPLPLLDEQQVVVGKHPSGMPALSRRLPRPLSSRVELQVDPGIGEELERASTGESPARIFLRAEAERLFGEAARQIGALRSAGMDVTLAYSVKTNPDARLLAVALKHGWMAEVTSAQEAALAERAGFPRSSLIVNGRVAPVWLARNSGQPCAAVFADSLEALSVIAVSREAASIVGIRVRTEGSTFGVDLGNPAHFGQAVDLLSSIGGHAKLGLHVHASEEVQGRDQWNRTADRLLAWASAIRSETGREVACLDIGGGWSTRSFFEFLLPRLPEWLGAARDQLPGLSRVILEPGRAVSQPTMALLTRVVEVRGRPVSELVVDAAISDVPFASQGVRRIAARRHDGTWSVIAPGHAMVLGRLCMEDDVLGRDLCVSDDTKEGNLLAILDVGAYDTSMAYPFGNGTHA